jgi:hypothetical protein
MYLKPKIHKPRRMRKEIKTTVVETQTSVP